MANHSKFFNLIKMLDGYSRQHQEMIKESLVWDFSGKKTQSLSEMYDKYPQGYAKMMAWLENETRKPRVSSAEQKLELKSRRSKILKILTQIGVDTMSAALGNWTAVNDYLSSPKIAGKTLDRMSLDELEACRVKLQSIATKEKKRMEGIKRLEKLN